MRGGLGTPAAPLGLLLGRPLARAPPADSPLSPNTGGPLANLYDAMHVHKYHECTMYDDHE